MKQASPVVLFCKKPVTVTSTFPDAGAVTVADGPEELPLRVPVKVALAVVAEVATVWKPEPVAPPPDPVGPVAPVAPAVPVGP
jgi:hypothetical protein